MRETEMNHVHYSSVPQSTGDTIHFRIKNSEDSSSWEVRKLRRTFAMCTDPDTERFDTSSLLIVS